MSGQQRDSDPQYAYTLANGIEILACFQRGEKFLGNKDFAERTGLSPSTVARLTYTLVELGFLRRMPGSPKYRPGLKLLLTAYPMLADMQLRQLARPLMRDLAERVNGAVSIVVRDRYRMVYVETSRANELLETHPDIGAWMPMLSTAAGKAWLCHAPSGQRESVLNQLRVRDPAYYEACIQQFPAAQVEYQQTRCCSNQGQWRKDSYGFATVLERQIDSMTFIFNCGVPSSDGVFEDRRQEVVPQLLALVQSLDGYLGR
ncbi:IclR family transcriptional regulator [Candidimonas nitroreducens]|uniref:IclR family transcriptional regulator n=1 Tax=Candidimonas nitroreducens TaxID=683354 RepID=A0A225MKY0_9BURK|nr:IclR family transcriptional regulator [Candidimonas nitroreducens]OWT60181.1 IclR family transcriptional regulator [Candidimonas nitroreducens]